MSTIECYNRFLSSISGHFYQIYINIEILNFIQALTNLELNSREIGDDIAQNLAETLQNNTVK